MNLDDHIGFFLFAGVDVLAVVSCAVALGWAAVNDGREHLARQPRQHR